MIMDRVLVEESQIQIKPMEANRHALQQRVTRSGHLIDPAEYVSPEKRTYGHSRLALLLTCRQAYREGWLMYYTLNTFKVAIDDLESFVDHLPDRCCAVIRSLIITFQRGDNWVGFTWDHLAPLRDLRHLEYMTQAPTAMRMKYQLDNYRQGVEMLPCLRKFCITLWGPPRLLGRLVVRERVSQRLPEVDDDLNIGKLFWMLVRHQDDAIENALDKVLRLRERTRQEQATKRPGEGGSRT